MFFHTQPFPDVDAAIAAAVAALIDSAPETLDTLNELAAALNDDNNFAITVALAIAEKADADDVYTKLAADLLLAAKADASSVYTKTATDLLLAVKADASSVYTKTAADLLLAAKADASSVYTKAAADLLLAAKADASSVYTKTDADLLLAGKAGKAEANTFTKPQIVLPDSASALPLTVRNHASATGNIIEIRSSGNANRLSVGDSGYTTITDVQANGGLRAGTTVTYTPGQRWVSVENAASVPSTVSSGLIAYSTGGQLEVRTPLANVGLTAKRVSEKAADYTFVGADQGALVILNDTTNRTFTVPADGTTNFPIGTKIEVATMGLGHLTVAAAAGATVAGKAMTMNQQYEYGVIVKIAANSWLFSHF